MAVLLLCCGMFTKNVLFISQRKHGGKRVMFIILDACLVTMPAISATQ